MRRSGTVAIIDQDQGAAAIATADRGYTIIELDPEWTIAVGDTIAWDSGDDLGFQSYENVGNGTRGDIFVQNHDVSEKALKLQFG